MKLGELIKIQNSGALKVKRIPIEVKEDSKYIMLSSGALKVDENYREDKAIIGGVELEVGKCSMVVRQLGWVDYDMSPIDIIHRTNRLINGIKMYINREDILRNTDVIFSNSRRLNTMSYLDRIKMVYPDRFDITILHGVPGKGRRYVVNSSVDNFKKPVYECSSMKKLGEWINKL